ncbi:Uncharacterised protein [Kluyvera cryocrescens]|uniref:Uncharacterized protein n=1 Tax=Kluyvera cryocrescens TaxID=580 RepID=A0A485CFF1_KLUCR|nr:Uncharacterised protein [Kluyvera cryocrescens]
MQVLNQPTRIAVGESQGAINALFQTLQQEYAADSEMRAMMLHSQLTALMVWLNRQGTQQAEVSDKVERKRARGASF